MNWIKVHIVTIFMASGVELNKFPIPISESPSTYRIAEYGNKEIPLPGLSEHLEWGICSQLSNFSVSHSRKVIFSKILLRKKDFCKE